MSGPSWWSRDATVGVALVGGRKAPRLEFHVGDEYDDLSVAEARAFAEWILAHAPTADVRSSNKQTEDEG
jgi:hypothetical protein